MRSALIGCCLLLLAPLAFAQDTLVLRSGRSAEIKLISTTESSITFETIGEGTLKATIRASELDPYCFYRLRAKQMKPPSVPKVQVEQYSEVKEQISVLSELKESLVKIAADMGTAPQTPVLPPVGEGRLLAVVLQHALLDRARVRDDGANLEARGEGEILDDGGVHGVGEGDHQRPRLHAQGQHSIGVGRRAIDCLQGLGLGRDLREVDRLQPGLDRQGHGDVGLRAGAHGHQALADQPAVTALLPQSRLDLALLDHAAILEDLPQEPASARGLAQSRDSRSRGSWA